MTLNDYMVKAGEPIEVVEVEQVEVLPARSLGNKLYMTGASLIAMIVFPIGLILFGFGLAVAMDKEIIEDLVNIWRE